LNQSQQEPCRSFADIAALNKSAARRSRVGQRYLRVARDPDTECPVALAECMLDVCASTFAELAAQRPLQ